MKLHSSLLKFFVLFLSLCVTLQPLKNWRFLALQELKFSMTSSLSFARDVSTSEALKREVETVLLTVVTEMMLTLCWRGLRSPTGVDVDVAVEELASLSPVTLNQTKLQHHVTTLC